MFKRSTVNASSKDIIISKGSSGFKNELPQSVNIIFHILLITFSLFAILPLVMIFSASLSDEQALLRNGYSLLPQGFSLNAYEWLFGQGSVVGTAYRNTIITTLAGTLLCVTTVSLYAYPLSRKDFKFKGFFTFISFFTMLFGAGLVPSYVLITQVLNLNNTLWVLFLPMGFSAYWVIVMRTFYRSNIPDDIIESARVDGSGEWRTLIQIVLPLSTSGLATIGLFTAIGIWNNFYFNLLYVTDPRYINLQYFMYSIMRNIQYLREAATSMGVSAGNLGINLSELPNESFRMAMAIVTIGPIILAYPFFQRYFVKGLTIGAVKG